MSAKLIKNPTSSSERLFDRHNNQDSNPIAVLLPALSNLRAAVRFDTIANNCVAFRSVFSVPPLTPDSERFTAGQLLKKAFLERKNHSISKFNSNLGREIAGFLTEKINTPSQWQAILEPCIPPTGAQVSVLRNRAPH